MIIIIMNHFFLSSYPPTLSLTFFVSFVFFFVFAERLLGLSRVIGNLISEDALTENISEDTKNLSNS